MKKHFISYIIVVFCFSLFFTDLLLKAQEVNVSTLNKVALKSSKQEVFLDLRGSFKGLTEDAILLTQEVDGFIIELQKTLLGTAKDKKIKNSVPEKVSNIELQGEEAISRIKLVTNKNIEISNISIKKKKVIISLNFTESILLREKLTESNTTEASEVIVNDNIQSGITVSKLYKKPEQLNITILHNKITKKKAYNLSRILLKNKKIRIESTLDLKLNVVSITQMPMENYGRNVIYFKSNHYLSAIYLSDILKDVYVIMPFAKENIKKEVFKMSF